MKLIFLLICLLFFVLGQTLAPKNLVSHDFNQDGKIEHKHEEESQNSQESDEESDEELDEDSDEESDEDSDEESDEDSQENEEHLQDPYTMKAVEIATTKTMEKLLDDPSAAAKIPTKLIKGGIDGLIEAFSGAWNLKDRYRSLQLTFVNLTPKTVEYEDDYFNSGTWFQTWKPEMKPKSINQGTVANAQGSWGTGVTGSIKLSILGAKLFVYLGFTNPNFGSYKFSGAILPGDKQARYGYDNAFNNSPKLVKNLGYKLQVIQTPSTIAQMCFVYQLSPI